MRNCIDCVTDALLDIDGSLRDVNFVAVSEDCVPRMFAHLKTHFESIVIMKLDGAEVRDTSILDWSTIKSVGGLRAFMSAGKGIFSQAQCLVEPGSLSNLAVEFSFLPEDVKDVPRVIPFLQDMSLALEATRFWVRYENASWTYGDVSPSSGVIFDSATGLFVEPSLSPYFPEEECE